MQLALRLAGGSGEARRPPHCMRCDPPPVAARACWDTSGGRGRRQEPPTIAARSSQDEVMWYGDASHARIYLVSSSDNYQFCRVSGGPVAVSPASVQSALPTSEGEVAK
jgi:hypothetical protein